MKIFYAIALLCLCFNLTAQQDFRPEVMSQRLQSQLAEEDGYHHISILLADRVDVAALDVEFYAKRVGLQERVSTLLSQLQDKASTTQVDLLAYLSDAEGVEKQSINSYWITNLIFVKARPEVVAALSNRSDVEWMDINAELAQTEVEEIPAGIAAMPQPDNTEPGLRAINAPALWAMGYTGYGKTAFANDTGVDPIHPAFNLKYRGFYVPGEQAWFEMNSENTQPFDCSDHGTHTLGTMVGLDRNTNDTIGVAYNALWVGAPILCGIGTEDNIAAFQWALDPDEDINTFEDMPDVINNSWRDPSLQEEDCTSIYVSVLNALEASGVAVIFSAGNSGPDPSTITPPHNINTGLVNSMTVGALNGNNSSLNIADFSSRGPSQCGGTESLLIKPEVSAPGVSVRSCVLNGEYGLKSGTSMAAPHVAGAVLLLKEAFPYLTGLELKLALYNTCTDLGDPGEDNVFGMGIINVLEAYNYLVDAGNTPVDPAVAYDVMLIDVKVSDYVCNGKYQPVIKVENAGTETITSFAITYGIGGNEMNYDWTGELLPGGRTEIVLPEATSAGGNTFRIELGIVNGDIVDQRPLNNVYVQMTTIITEYEFSAKVDQVEENEACENSSVALRAEYNVPGTITWYDAAEDGQVLGTGEVLLIDSVNLDQSTVYAEYDVNQKVGLEGDVPANQSYSAQNDNGLLFDAYYPFRLKTVKIYAENTGLLVVQLRRLSGQGLASQSLLISQTGEQLLTLNMQVPEGENLVLTLSDGISLMESSVSPSIYPFDVDAVMSIKESIAGDAFVYPYFYDWAIDFKYHCGRAAVEVPVITSANAPEAAFSVSSNEVDIDVDALVTFTDNAIGAVAWHWDFGDGSTSDETSPAYTYTTPGTFYVTQTVVNADGCSDAYIDTIQVMGTLVSTQESPFEEEAIAIYPNPTRDQLIVAFDLQTPQKMQIRIVDLLGREIKRIAPQEYHRQQVELDLQSLQSGIYLIIFETEDFRTAKRIVKAN